MPAPILATPIPAQVINERAAYGPFDLKQFIQSAEGNSAPRFTAQLSDGQALPKGMICTSDGIVTGIPAENTQGTYEVIITAENDAGPLQATFVLTIKPSLATSAGEYSDELKKQIWEALEKNLPIPDLKELYNRPITPLEIYYFLERWGVLKIWDAFNLDPPGPPVLLTLEGASKHYNVYDRGSCLVVVPKDLFSYERTLADGLQTASVAAREIFKRNWTIELMGFEKMVRAAWVEINHLGDQYGKQLEIINFNPTPRDIKIYMDESFSESKMMLKGNLE